MKIRSVMCCAVFLALASSAWGDEKKAPRKEKKLAVKTAKTPAKAEAKTPQKGAVKAHPKAGAKASARRVAKAPALPAHKVVRASLKPAPTAAVLHGPKEVLTCRDGTEDRHARIAMVLVGGKPDSFAYYSKWKPRTCSIYLQRNRDTSKWLDQGRVTNVSTDKGMFLIEQEKSVYRLVFRDVDRERYCGMDGTLNGTLTMRKGSERCDIAGLMEEGVPLGQAVAYMEQQNAHAMDTVAAAPVTATKAAPRRHALEPAPRDAGSPFPRATVGIGD